MDLKMCSEANHGCAGWTHFKNLFIPTQKSKTINKDSQGWRNSVPSSSIILYYFAQNFRCGKKTRNPFCLKHTMINSAKGHFIQWLRSRKNKIPKRKTNKELPVGHAFMTLQSWVLPATPPRCYALPPMYVESTRQHWINLPLRQTIWTL